MCDGVLWVLLRLRVRDYAPPAVGGLEESHVGVEWFGGFGVGAGARD